MLKSQKFTDASNFRELSELLKRDGRWIIPSDSIILGMMDDNERLLAWAKELMERNPGRFFGTLAIYVMGG